MRSLLTAAVLACLALTARAAEPQASPPPGQATPPAAVKDATDKAAPQGLGTGKARQDTSGQGAGKAQHDTSGQGTGKPPHDASGQGTPKSPPASAVKVEPPKAQDPKPCEPVKPCSID